MAGYDYPMATKVVDRLNLGGRKRFGYVKDRPYDGGDAEAVAAVVSTAAMGVSGEFGMVMRAFVEQVFEELETLQKENRQLRARLPSRAKKETAA